MPPSLPSPFISTHPQAALSPTHLSHYRSRHPQVRAPESHKRVVWACSTTACVGVHCYMHCCRWCVCVCVRVCVCVCVCVCVFCSVDSSLCCTPQLKRGSSFPDSVGGTPELFKGVSVKASPKEGGPSSGGGRQGTRTTKRTRSDDVTLLKGGSETRSSKRSKSESLSGSRKVCAKCTCTRTCCWY